MTKTVVGWLQLGMMVFAGASSSGLIHLDPQLNDILIAIVSGLAGTHALKSAKDEAK